MWVGSGLGVLWVFQIWVLVYSLLMANCSTEREPSGIFREKCKWVLRVKRDISVKERA